MSVRLVLDLATDRIIHFTTGDEKLFSDAYSVIVTHDGELPKLLEHNNSWAWTYKNKKFNNSEVKTPPISNFEQNKKSILEIVESNILRVFNNRYPNVFHVATFLLDKNNDGDGASFVSKLNQFRNETIEKINNCKTSLEIFGVRDKFLSDIKNLYK